MKQLITLLPLKNHVMGANYGNNNGEIYVAKMWD